MSKRTTFTSVLISLYRAGVIGGIIGMFLYLQNGFVGRREFEDYKSTHRDWGNEVTRRIEGRLDRIERKLDTMRLGWWQAPDMHTNGWRWDTNGFATRREFGIQPN